MYAEAPTPAVLAYAAAQRADAVHAGLKPATVRRYARAAEQRAREAERAGWDHAAGMAREAARYARQSLTAR